MSCQHTEHEDTSWPWRAAAAAWLWRHHLARASLHQVLPQTTGTLRSKEIRCRAACPLRSQRLNHVPGLDVVPLSGADDEPAAQSQAPAGTGHGCPVLFSNATLQIRSASGLAICARSQQRRAANESTRERLSRGPAEGVLTPHSRALLGAARETGGAISRDRATRRAGN